MRRGQRRFWLPVLWIFQMVNGPGTLIKPFKENFRLIY
jgi:hypothetical protein